MALSKGWLVVTVLSVIGMLVGACLIVTALPDWGATDAGRFGAILGVASLFAFVISFGRTGEPVSRADMLKGDQ